MKIFEPERTKKFEEHFRLFRNSEYFKSLSLNAKTFWGEVRNLRAHPASAALFIDSFVEFYTPNGDLREDLKAKFFMQNSRAHDLIASRIYNDSSVLDLGAGIGCLKDMLDLHGKKADYYAQDISARLIGLNPAEDEKRYCCDFEALPELLAGKRFDFVVDCNATHNLSGRRENYLRLMERLTMLGGCYLYHCKSGGLKEGDLKKFKNIRII